MTDSITSIEESSSLTDRVNEILHSKALADLHALAWIETFFNKRDGNWDPGWSCRDHSVVLAALLTAKRIEARVVHGLTMFVQGPTTDGAPAVGNGNDPAAGGGHSWVQVPGFGTVDVSPRLSERLDDWRPLPVEGGLIGGDWSIPRTTTHVARSATRRTTNKRSPSRRTPRIPPRRSTGPDRPRSSTPPCSRPITSTLR